MWTKRYEKTVNNSNNNNNNNTTTCRTSDKINSKQRQPFNRAANRFGQKNR